MVIGQDVCSVCRNVKEMIRGLGSGSCYNLMFQTSKNSSTWEYASF